MPRPALAAPDSDPFSALSAHGGNLDVARQLFPDAPEPWIDLSTGINPRAYPIGRIPASVWNRLPDPGALRELETAARIAYGARAAQAIVAAPGTQSIIQRLPEIMPARRVGILGETYSEHARVWSRARSRILPVDNVAELAECDVGVVVNPNNPDGRLLAPEALLAVAAKMAARGGTLTVDEAFMDVIDPRMSLVPHLPHTAVIVLRSFGKVFGLAGLRLGFALGPAPLIERLRSELGPWAVSGQAIEIGQRALSDPVWLDRERVRLARQAKRLDHLLRNAGFHIAGGTSLFRLARHAQARAWFERLGQAGILCRPFAFQTDTLRFGIPSGPRAWKRVTAALKPISS